MKIKRYLLLVTFLTFFYSCNDNFRAIQPEPLAKINILSKIQPKMEYPYDIEVTKDGKTIYFKNWYNYPKNEEFYLNDKKEEYIEKWLKRKVIYKLDTETKKIEVFKIGDDPFIYNNLSEDLELDNDGNLYVSDMENKKIIKVSTSGKIIKNYSINIHNSDIFNYSVDKPANLAFNGRINLCYNNGNIYYLMFVYSEEIPLHRFYIINKIDINNDKISQFYKSDDGQKPIFFSINNNMIFSDIHSQGISIFDVDLNKFISDYNTKWDNFDFSNLKQNIFNKKTESFVKINENIKFNSKKQPYSLGEDIIYKYNIDKKEINIIGNYPYGLKDGKSNEASFDYPSSLSIDKKDNIYVADTGNNAIRKITPEGEVSTFYKEKD